MAMKKVFFIDRDGVINIEKNYLYRIEEFEFIPGVKEALRYIQDRGYEIIIITNQSGIGRGYYTKEDFNKLTSWMVNELKKDGINILRVYFCPHTPQDNCECRKPKIGMITQALSEFEIDLQNSWLVGDKDSDIICANNANISNTIQVKSGHSFEKSRAKYVLNSLADIKEVI
jgi:D-glycero-D-manno-heptose 1,7-bisphosphate phosphatase